MLTLERELLVVALGIADIPWVYTPAEDDRPEGFVIETNGMSVVLTAGYLSLSRGSDVEVLMDDFSQLIEQIQRRS